MRTLFVMVAVAFFTMSFEACKKKRDTGDIITQKVVKAKPSEPVAMQEYYQRKDIDWAGGKLMCEIQRLPDDSLPMVKDETGQEHIDNRIILTIKRSDGSMFFAKTFTKTTFDNYLDSDYRKTGVLEGLVFDKIFDEKLRFAASVSHPQTDEYIPLVVDVSRQGTMTIARDTQMDTNGSSEDDEERM